jgi:hypothetical protein
VADTDFLNVKAGDPVTMELWNKMVAAARSTQLCLGGENVNIHRMPHGSLINSRFVKGYQHPWRMIASYAYAQFYPATVNGITPTVTGPEGKDVLINNNPAPVLPMSKSEWDDKGFGWMALELTYKDNWKTISKAEIVQRANITRQDKQHLDTPQLYLGYAGLVNSETGVQIARYPLVRLQRVDSQAGDLKFNFWQVAMFNLQTQATPPIQGQTSVSRHYFWPT